jgi:hypothetical protein
VSKQHGTAVIRRVLDKKLPGMKVVYLYLDGSHFDLITSMSGFLSTNEFCDHCDRPYALKAKHRCLGICRCCYRPTEDCEEGTKVPCANCNRAFNNQVCFDLHKKIGSKSGKSSCNLYFVCDGCGKFVNMERRPKGAGHLCGETYCTKCEVWTEGGAHKCYLKVPKVKPYDEDPKIIIFDYETTTDEENRHVPCAVIAQYLDGQEFRFPPDGVAMTGYNANNEFGKWLFHERHKGFTIIAHNFRAYDGQFVLQYMLDNGLKPVVIKNGTKLMDLRLEKYVTIFFLVD